MVTLSVKPEFCSVCGCRLKNVRRSEIDDSVCEACFNADIAELEAEDMEKDL